MDEAIRTNIQRHAIAAYPEECCGLLLGQEDRGLKLVKELRETQNAAEDFRHRRYSIDPKDLFAAENYVKKRGWDVIGIYHSHPDHSSRPSEHDRKHAILHYSYVIISVKQEHVGELSSWILPDWDSPFEPEELRITRRETED